MSVCTACGATLPEGARFCPSCAAPVETTVPAPPEERKLATLLFADLVGSTAFASNRDPEHASASLERFYDLVTAEIQASGGTVRQFAGDSVLAVFGVPAALEDHAERALHAALAMQRRMQEVFDSELQLRIGVNTGEIVVAREREGASLVTGDTANVAARLEQGAAPGEILVGARTVSAVRGAFEFGEPRTIDAKGKPEGVACRHLVRALSLARPRGVGGLRAAFVGRERELALLQDAYREVVDRREPRLVTILGDAGVGKSRVVRELWSWLAGQDPQPLQRTGRCLSYGQTAYWALGDILREQLGLRESDSPETALEHLRGREILGLALGLDVAGDLHPLIARDRFQDAWVSLLEELTAEQPVALLIEDVHWAEDPLLDLLEHVLARVDGALLVLATARPELLETRPGFGRERGSTVGLEPLEPDTTDRLVAQLLGTDPPEALRTVVAQAEGNPFFCEEVLGSLIDRNLLRRDNGEWMFQELPEGFVVPDTVQAVVASRIDLLEPREKTALQAASVIGRIFWSGPVYELCADLEPDLRLLEDRDFVRLRDTSAIEGEREYTIKHAVTREVAYASIPKAKRARLHASFAAWVERFGGGRDEHAPLLAHHYAEAVRPEDADLAWAAEDAEMERLRGQAVIWLRRAAELAVGRYEIDEGLAYLERAVALESSETEQAKLWREIGLANALKYDGEGLREAMERSLALPADRETRAETYAQLAFHAGLRAGMWRQRPDPELVDPWIDRALELAEPESATHVRALVARAYWHPDRGDEPAREASDLANRVGDLELRSYAWMARASAAFQEQRFADARGWIQRRLDVIPELNDPDHVTEILECDMPTLAAVGRFDEARRSAQQHVELSERLSPHHRVHGVAMISELDELTGRWEAIRERIDRVEALVTENAATPCIRNARTLLVCAMASASGGDDERSRELEREADEVRLQGHAAAIEGAEIRLALIRGDLPRVERSIPIQSRHNMTFGLMWISARLDGLAALRERTRVEEDAPPFLEPGTYLEPFALRALGIVRDDDALIAQAQERFATLGLDWHAAQTDALARGV